MHQLERERILLILEAYRNLLPEEKRSKIDHVTVEIKSEKQVQAGVSRGQEMVFYDGILLLMENEHETAMLVAHELGHVLENHYTKKRISNALAAIAGAAAGAAIGGVIKNPYLAQTTAQLMATGVAEGMGNVFSQKYEKTADRHAVQLAYAAGFNIPLGIGLWKKFMETFPENGWLDYYGTHPPTKARITAMTGQYESYTRQPATVEVGGQDGEVVMLPEESTLRKRLETLNAEIALLKQQVDRAKFVRQLKEFYSKFPQEKRRWKDNLTEEQNLAEVEDVGLSKNGKAGGGSFDGKVALNGGSVSWFVKFYQGKFTPYERLNDPPRFKARWYAPDGELYQEKYFGFSTAIGNTVSTELQLDLALGGYLVGRWRLEVFFNDMFLDERFFEVTRE